MLCKQRMRVMTRELLLMSRHRVRFDCDACQRIQNEVLTSLLMREPVTMSLKFARPGTQIHVLSKLVLLDTLSWDILVLTVFLWKLRLGCLTMASSQILTLPLYLSP